MSDRVYSRGAGKLWHQLAESKLTSKAKLCYAVMGSFGTDETTWAKVATIARRMSVSDHATVRAAQKELVAAGWLFLVKEGQGSDGRIWWLNDKPFEHLNDEWVKDRISAIQQGVVVVKNRGVEKPNPYRGREKPESGKTIPLSIKPLSSTGVEGLRSSFTAESRKLPPHPRSRASREHPEDPHKRLSTGDRKELPTALREVIDRIGKRIGAEVQP